MCSSDERARNRRVKSILITINEELALAENNPGAYCPGYVTSRMHVKDVLQEGGKTIKLINEHKECYQCNGKDLSCQVYWNYLNQKLLS